MKKIIFVLVVNLFSLVACQNSSDKNYQPPKTSPLTAMSVEEREKALVNDAFVSAYEGDVEKLKAIATSDPKQLEVINGNGDTSLAVVIEQRHSAAATELILHLSVEHFLKYKNSKGQGYIYLAAKSGDVQVISAIAEKYKSSLGALNDWEFADLDFPDKDGRKALHVASGAAVADVLSQYYYSVGYNELPFYQFTLAVDKDANIYLHLAAQEGRSSVVEWGVEKNCTRNSWDESDNILKAAVGTAWTYVQRLPQALVSPSGWFGNEIAVNLGNKDHNTPIHLASIHHQWESLKILATCEWADYFAQNNLGDIPLQSLLRSLDASVNVIDQASRNAFLFLLEKRTKLSLWQTEASYIDAVNEEGQTSLHLAAKLRDPFFYNELAKIGNTELPDNSGQKPSDIFALTRNRVKDDL